MHMCAHMCVRKYVHIGCMCACCVLCIRSSGGKGGSREEGGQIWRRENEEEE